MEGPQQENPAEPPKVAGEANGSSDTGRGPSLREIPLRLMIPNMITVLAICAGLSGIRLAFENRYRARRCHGAASPPFSTVSTVASRAC